MRTWSSSMAPMPPLNMMGLIHSRRCPPGSTCPKERAKPGDTPWRHLPCHPKAPPPRGTIPPAQSRGSPEVPKAMEVSRSP